MKPYPEYKPTGLAWLPEIPKHWDVVPLAAYAKEKSITNQTDLELLSVYLDRGVIRFSEVSAKRTNVTSEDLSKYQRVDVGDLVLNNQQAWRGSVGVSPYTGIVSPAYIVLELSDKLHKRFANYLFRDNSMVTHYAIASKGIGSIQRNLYWINLKRKNLFLPPFPEQAQIVRYLDAMTAKINKLIRAKKRQIALLQEQKQAIINQAVTRGLDPDVELKDSGIDWLGPIPKQWQIVRMKNLFSFINRGTTPDYIEDRSYTKVVNQATFSKGYWDETQIRFTRVSPDIARGLLKQNDVLLASTGGGVLGKVYLFIQNGTYIADSHVTILRTQRKDVSPAYFFALLSTMYDFINAKLAKGSTNQTELQKDLLCSLVVPFPDIETQNVIVDFLDQKINIINLLIQQYQKIIEQYAEYKNSLIAAVVTGKVDVRKIAVEAVSAEDLTPSDDPDESEEQDSPVSEESEE